MMPTPAAPAPPRNLASATLRSVGLAGNKRKATDSEGDAKMRAATHHDKPGGRKGHAKTNSHKVRSSYRTRGAEALLGKDQPGPSTRNMVNTPSLRRVAHPACCYACLLSVCLQCVH